MALEQEYLLKQEEAEETYQKKLTAGSGININPTTNVISVTGGSGSSVTYTSEYPQGETIGILEIDSVQNPIKMPELIPGDNISITPDPTTGALTIDSTGGGNVDDVKIGNTSIVDANKIANIPTMTGATSQAAGSAGVVPAPLATDVDKFLKADGTWDDCSSATELTKAQYDALPSSKESDGVLYMIKDIDTTSGTTSDLTRAAYDLLPASKESDDIFYYITDEGVIMHNGVQYAGGGSSSVIANPSGTPTDTLQTVEIDGTIYEIEGGSTEIGKGPFIDTSNVIASYNASTYTSGTEITATEDIFVSFHITPGYGTGGYFYIDGVSVLQNWYEANSTRGYGYYVQKGQVFKIIYTPYDSGTSRFGMTIYGLLDQGNGKDYFNPIIYSTEEREVGVWTDNKPLYQKTVRLTSFINGGSTSLGITDIETIVDYTIMAYRGNNDNGWSDNNSVGNEELVTINSDGGLYYRSSNSHNSLIVTIWYTKTTDVAGSGSYNTLGVPMVHYDDNEQVIGTWFGKPLYQKIIIITLEATDSNWHNVNHNITNIEDFVKVEGLAINSTTKSSYPIPGYRPSNNVGFCLNATLTTIDYINNWLSTDQLRVILQYTKTTD